MSDALQSSLIELEQRVQHALVTNDRSGLEILGHGESTIVLAIDTPSGRIACKRLPPFASWNELHAYTDVIPRYCDALRARGVAVLETRVETVGQVAYCVQPALHPQQMLKSALTCERLAQLLDVIVATVTDRIGLDADMTNWSIIDDRLVFIDVTTPMLRDERLRSEVDYTPFLLTLPRFVRAFLSRATAEAMLEKFYSPRAIVLDVLAGLMRQRVGHVACVLEAASHRVSPPITSGELRRYFASNESIWILYRRMQRLQQWWETSVRERTYPFLLPPPSAFAGHFSLASLFAAQTPCRSEVASSR